MADLPRGVERSVRMYRMLLKAYPAAFQRKYEDEMVRVFRELAADAQRQHGASGLVTMWFRVLGDVAWTALKEHFSESKTLDGGIDMKVKSMLMRRISSNAADCRLGQIGAFGASLLVLVLGVWKFTSMRLTEPQLFFGILLVATLTVQCVGLGLLAPLDNKPGVNRTQIVIYGLTLPLLVLGVWKLASMAVTEYELISGLLLIFVVIMAVFFIGGIVPLLKPAASVSANPGKADTPPSLC
jgi:hypothetical protein